MGKISRLISAVSLLNSVFVVIFGFQYLNGGMITQDTAVGIVMLTFGFFCFIGFIGLYSWRQITARREIKKVLNMKKV